MKAKADLVQAKYKPPLLANHRHCYIPSIGRSWIFLPALWLEAKHQLVTVCTTNLSIDSTHVPLPQVGRSGYWFADFEMKIDCCMMLK